MNPADRIRLQHMLEAARIGVKLTQGEARASLDQDDKLQLALTRAVEIVGEAASKVSPETRAIYPQLPWSGMIGMHNILIHAYFSIDLDTLWDTATTNLPLLIIQLETILTSSPA